MGGASNKEREAEAEAEMELEIITQVCKHLATCIAYCTSASPLSLSFTFIILLPLFSSLSSSFSFIFFLHASRQLLEMILMSQIFLLYPILSQIQIPPLPLLLMRISPLIQIRILPLPLLLVSSRHMTMNLIPVLVWMEERELKLTYKHF